ncbi:MAG: sigma-70 family RNA polymerase sigma factor [Bacteroidota bacterium]
MLSKDADIHRDIVADCQRGNRQSFYKLYKLYSKGMFNVCMRMLNKREIAEDVLQEAFADAFRQIGSFRFESTFGAWLKQIVVNKCMTEMKKNYNGPEYLDDMEKIDVVDQDNGAVDEEELAMNVERVKRAMAQLPDGSRSILSLYLFEGYDHTEIAEILKISESTSKSQYMRARLRVKEILMNSNHETRPT